MARSPSTTLAPKARAPRADARLRSAGLFNGYEPLPDTFDELFAVRGQPHAYAERVVQRLDRLSRTEYRTLHTLADKTFLRSGVTFSVYSGHADPDRIFPFDLVPRIVSGTEWRNIERGLVQRIHALNAFLQDVYGPQRILDDGTVPREMVESSKAFLPVMCGVVPPRGVHVHIAGVDLIRGPRSTACPPRSRSATSTSASASCRHCRGSISRFRRESSSGCWARTARARPR